MKVDFIDLKSRYKLERQEILKTLDKVLKKGHLVLTNELEEFEQKICQYTKQNYCLGLNSGTDALMMSLWALGIGKGDEVITSPTSFIATVGAITHVGAKPVFVDVKEDFNIDEDKIVSKINKKYVGTVNLVTGSVNSFFKIAEKIKDLYKVKIKYIRRNGPMPHNGYRAFNNNLLKKILPKKNNFTKIFDSINKKEKYKIK